MNKATLIVGGLVAGGILLFLVGRQNAPLFLVGRQNAKKEVEEWQIDSNMGAHRGLAPTYGVKPTPTRMASAQDKHGGAADYLGYNYKGTTPSVYAKGEPAQGGGKWYDKREDAWAFIEQSPIDYQKPPLRIPKLWKDANRFWDGINSHGGTEVIAQRFHLFHLRPSMPTRGYRSISGVFNPIGGGMSTASRARIPAIFVPSVIS